MKQIYTHLDIVSVSIKGLEPIRPHIDQLRNQLQEAHKDINSIIHALKDAFPADLESQGVA